MRPILSPFDDVSNGIACDLDTRPTYSSTHQRCSLFERNSVWEMHGGFWVGQHVFSECTIMPEASHNSSLTEARIRTFGSPRVLATSCALPTCILVVQNTHAISNFPRTLYVRANLYDFASRLMRRNHWQFCRELPIPYLQVRVTKASCVHLNEEVMVATLRYSSLT